LTGLIYLFCIDVVAQQPTVKPTSTKNWTNITETQE
jgi:hypothetical protein